ncbi:MAG TPA: D-alanine--D-alanine ligase family protein [Candidatus Sulfotelmatobacter sp.]|nr:D-alanine--D-alanine ligase family protein [Candidatus Sulfotelmatobacter sp.]
MRVGLVFGSRSVEHEISVTTASKAYEALRQLADWETVPLYVTKAGAWLAGPAVVELLTVEAEGRAAKDPGERKAHQADYKRRLQELARGAGQVEALFLAPDSTVKGLVASPAQRGWFKKAIGTAVDVAFPTVHGTHGEDGTLQGLFELADIAYVGCGVAASAVGMDKVQSKLLFRGAGLPVLPAVWFTRWEWLGDEAEVVRRVEAGLTYPVVVKPAVAGSSVGIARATSAAELARAAGKAIQFATRVIVERSVEQRLEIQCGILGNHDLQVSLCEELAGAGGIVSFEDKYLRPAGREEADLAPSHIPARIPEALAKEIQTLALAAYRVLDARGIARVDFLVDTGTRQAFVNEINTLPGSLCLRLWEATGVPPATVVRRLLDLALEAHRERAATRFESEEGAGLVDKKHLMAPGK